MPAVEVREISKRYGQQTAVDSLTFEVEAGEIFGLIGPNGAGKTSTIRMMMDIVKPDLGSINVLGEPLTESTKRRLGYLPEERGLYRKMRVIDTILYLASLKGMDRATALERAQSLLRRTDMAAHQTKRIEELSKGMGQLIQFLVTIVHDPELVILDEPFAGLDPVNTARMKEVIVEMGSRGKTIILSTHQMNQVEALCDRLLMVNHGRAVLYGLLAEIKSRYRGNAVLVEYHGTPPSVPGVAQRSLREGALELTLAEGMSAKSLFDRLAQLDCEITRFEVESPALNEIFLMAVGGTDE